MLLIALSLRYGAEAPYFGHLIQRANSLEKTPMLGKVEGRRRRVCQRIKWLDSITNLLDMNFSKRGDVEDTGARHAAEHGVTGSLT